MQALGNPVALFRKSLRIFNKGVASTFNWFLFIFPYSCHRWVSVLNKACLMTAGLIMMFYYSAPSTEFSPLPPSFLAKYNAAVDPVEWLPPRPDISKLTNWEKLGRRGLEVMLLMRVASSASVVTTSRRAIRPFWSRRHYDDYGWESLFKKIHLWVQIASFLFHMGFRRFLQRNFLYIFGWLANETSKRLCSGCISP